MVNLELYHRLSTRSKRAILRRRKKWGHPYRYQPRIDLVRNLAEETGKTQEQIRRELIELRQWLLSHAQYY